MNPLNFIINEVYYCIYCGRFGSLGDVLGIKEVRGLPTHTSAHLLNKSIQLIIFKILKIDI